MLNEDYPVEFNKEEFEDIQSFQGKLNYAVKHLRKIASGSARTVFQIDDQKVLKIAKNKKGLAQNSVEAEAFTQNYEITARTFDKSKDDFWVEMEFAKKLTPTRFKQIVGFSIDDIDKYLNYESSINRRRSFLQSHKPKNYDTIKDNEYAIELFGFMMDYDMPPGDLGRLSSYGEIVREGKPYVVLVDYGLTNSVFQDFYQVGTRK